MMETFIELLTPLGETVDVVLETSHAQESQGHTDLYREHIELPILQSILWDFEDLLINDGCTGIAVLNPNIPQEVQLDEHKLLLVYGKNLTPYEGILIDSSSQLPRGHEVHHRGRARPLDDRAVRPRVRRAEDAARHGRLPLAQRAHRECPTSRRAGYRAAVCQLQADRSPLAQLANSRNSHRLDRAIETRRYSVCIVFSLTTTLLLAHK